MMKTGRKDRQPTVPAGQPPKLLSFRTASLEGGALFEPRRQPWAKLYFVLSGVMEVAVEGSAFLSPPHYATWVPAEALHSCQNRRNVKFVSIYVEKSFCEEMPVSACTLALTPLVRAILTDFVSRQILVPEEGDDVRLALVLLDQLKKAPRRASYLPTSDDSLIQPITDALQLDPSDRRSLADWAELLDTTERTVSRRFHSCFGIPFNEWKQRLKLVAALSLIERGTPVHQIADKLGYSTPSAFIAMFKRQTGESPTQLSDIRTHFD
jgi:AraC-like DNA-binding protein